MGFTQGYSAYKEAGVKTASQGKLIIMLYDECIRQLASAIDKFNEDSKIEPQNIELFGKNIVKAQAIITELMVSLDMEAGGDISKNLMNLYIYFNQELLNANVAFDKEKIAFVKEMMLQLRSTWAEVVLNSASELRPVSAGLNISG